jgi:hypothetical protein
MAKSKIKIKPSRKGTFTSAAKQRNMEVQEFASQVLSNPENYSPAMRKKAQFAANSAKFGLGGDIFGGATSGLAAGSAFGPIGMGVGAVLGGAAGFIGGKKKQKAEEKQKRLQQQSRDRELAFAQYEPTGQQYQTMFEEGGEVKRKVRKIPPRLRVQDFTPFIEQQDRLNDLMVEQLERQNERNVPKVNAQDFTPFIKRQKVLDAEVENLEQEDKFACGGRAMKKFPLGGLLPYEDETMPIEAEGGESGVEPDGDQFDIQGPSHASGGVPMDAEAGTRIFSDRIKIPGDTKTFSDANKKIANKIVKYQETIDDSNATKVAKRTAERMLSRLQLEQDELFNQQQAINGDNKGQQEVLPKAQNGIEIPPRVNAQDFTPFFQSQQVLDAEVGQLEAQDPSNPFGVNDNNLVGQEYDNALAGLQGNNLDGKTGFGRALGSIGEGLQSFNQSGFGQALGGLSQAAPALMNIGQGLFGDVEQEDPNQFQNISGMAAASRLRNRKFDVDPQLAAIRRATATGKRNISQGSRTRGELLSNLGGLSAMEARQTSDVLSQKQNIENQYAGEAAQMTARLGSESAATRLNIARSNAANRGARRNILRSGVSQLGQLSQSRERTRNLKEADKIRLAALNQYFPNYTLGEDYQFNIK